jgi:NADH:ubiquinone oxidoreductase subunit 4 (subunit M)
VGALHAGLKAVSQFDFKRLTAALSMGWLALALLAMRLPAREGLTGAWLLVQSQGLAVTGLFLFVSILQLRLGPREADALECLAFQRPRLATMLIALLVGTGAMTCYSAAGLLLALSVLTWENAPFAACGIATSLLLICSMIPIVQRALFGRGSTSQEATRPMQSDESVARSPSGMANHLPRFMQSEDRADLTLREFIALAPFVILSAWLTLAPAVVVERGEPMLSLLLQRTERHTEAVVPSASDPAEPLP